MEKRTVICPNCGCRLSYMVQPGIENKILVCPGCKNKAKISEYEDYTRKLNEQAAAEKAAAEKAAAEKAAAEKAAAAQQIGKAGLGSGLLNIDDSDGGGETKPLIGPINHDPGQFHNIKSNMFLPLRRGRMTVGRLAESKKADIQIGKDDLDKYMSRLHIDLYIERGNDGSLRHIVKEHTDERTGKRPVNGTYINGRRMTEGEVAILNFGDTLTLGQTKLVLEHTDEEATQVIF